MRNTKYTTQLSQGAGLINETLSLILAYQKGMTCDTFTDYVRGNNILSCRTESRLKHIINDVFYMRFLKNDANVPLWLHQLRDRGISLKQLSQLLMIYCAREHAVFFDGVTQILNPLKMNGKQIIPRQDFLNFVNDIVSNGKAKWSEGMQKKNAGYIRSTMLDFDLIDQKGNILPYEPCDITILYLLYEQHLNGISDMAIWNMEEWQLFNMDKQQVLDRIMALSLHGTFMAQTSGEILTISWKYKNMEDFIDAVV